MRKQRWSARHKLEAPRRRQAPKPHPRRKRRTIGTNPKAARRRPPPHRFARSRRSRYRPDASQRQRSRWQDRARGCARLHPALAAGSHLKELKNAAATARSATDSDAKRALDFAKWGPIRRERLSPLRRTVSRRMVESWTTIPKINQFDDADITDLLALRKKYAAAFEKKGSRLTLTAFLLKSLPLA